MREYSKGYVCKDRGMWKAVVSWQDKDGRKRRLTKSTGIRCSTKKGDNRHKAAAQAFLEKWRQGLVDAEAPAGPSPGGAAATLAISDRVMDVMALSRILGHRDATVTLNVYADALEDSKRAGMDALDGTL